MEHSNSLKCQLSVRLPALQALVKLGRDDLREVHAKGKEIT